MPSQTSGSPGTSASSGAPCAVRKAWISRTRVALRQTSTGARAIAPASTRGLTTTRESRAAARSTIARSPRTAGRGRRARRRGRGSGCPPPAGAPGCSAELRLRRQRVEHHPPAAADRRQLRRVAEQHQRREELAQVGILPLVEHRRLVDQPDVERLVAPLPAADEVRAAQPGARQRPGDRRMLPKERHRPVERRPRRAPRPSAARPCRSATRRSPRSRDGRAACRGCGGSSSPARRGRAARSPPCWSAPAPPASAASAVRRLS